MNKSLEVVVASTNPVKIQAAKIGFERVFPHILFNFQGISVESGIGNQAMASAEARNGARNRATNAKKARPDAHYWVGLEGGVERDDHMFSQNPYSLRSIVWCATLKTGKDIIGEGQPGSYALPIAVCELILKERMELGAADDIVFNRSNSKQDEGSIGILTKGILNRGPYYAHAVILALIPFANQELYLP